MTEQPAQSPVRRSRWLVVTAVTAVAVATTAFAAGTLVDSPWREAVANSQAEPLVVATVEHREILPDASTAQGTYSPGTTLDLAAPALDTTSVVTAQTLRPGDQVGPGTVLTVISGRPVFALPLPFVLYRDLVPGTEGPDVVEVQRALTDLGLFDGTLDGVYGPATAAAVERLHDRAGHAAPLPDQALLDAVDAASAQVKSAKEALAAEQAAALTASPQPLTQAPEDGAEEPVTAADAPVDPAPQRAVDDAQAALTKARFAALTPLPQAAVAQITGTATVVSAAAVGTVLDDGASYAHLRTGAPSVVVRVGVATADAYAAGTAVTVRAITDSAQTSPGVVAAVSEFRDPDAETVPHVPGHDVTITFPDGPLPFTDGATLVVEPDGAQAPLAAGPAVPLTALRDGPAGRYVLGADATEHPVTVVALGGGYAVIEGVAEGTEVVVAGRPDSDR